MGKQFRVPSFEFRVSLGRGASSAAGCSFAFQSGAVRGAFPPYIWMFRTIFFITVILLIFKDIFGLRVGLSR